VGVVETYRGLFRNGPLTRLLAGEFVSWIGDWLYLVALVVLVYRETGDPVVLGIVGAARLIPYIALSIPAGAVADRFDRRLVLLASDLARAACMLVLAALVASGASIWPIAAVAILAACFSTFFYPAIGALVPSLVRDEREFGPANSAYATLDNLSWILGPAIAGLLLAQGDLVLAFVLNAASFSLVAVILWTLPAHRPAARPVTATAEEHAGEAARDGPAGAVPAAPSEPSRAFLGRPIPASINANALTGVVVLDAFTWFAFGGIGILVVVLATDVFHGGDAATGYLNAAIGVGGTVGALASAALVLRPRLGPVLLVGAGALGGATIVLGFASALGVALVAAAVASLGNLLLDVTRTTIVQRVVPDAYRGRLGGVMATVQSVAEASGTLLLPIVVTVAGFGVALGVTGVALIAASVVAIGLIGTAGDVAAGPYDADLRRIARLPVFGGLSPARVEEALRRFEPVPVVAGTVVVREGDPADRFFVINAGTFEVSQAAATGGTGTVIRSLGMNDVFGERGLLARAPRSATVTARSDGLLFALDGEAFLRLVGARTAVRERMLALYESPAVEVAGRG